MTFCLGMRCEEGLFALADTRITSGTETSTARKISIHQYNQHSMFIMTSGLRSIRDKAITYFEERLRNAEEIGRMYLAANALAEEIRNVRTEDMEWLIQGGLLFDLHCIFGGQLAEDDVPHMYLIYPEGNWVEVRSGTPFVIIGESRYGKPVVDRTWRHDRSLADAMRIALLAFDATRTSASDVDYPVDSVLYRADSFEIREQRFSRDDLVPLQDFWQNAIFDAVEEAEPTTRPLFSRLDAAPPARTRYGDSD
ncbi:MAG: peptidase [Dehalococcoidia bacterium]|nr:peptidase [Dehalococcoidia bacterium]